MGKSKYHVFTVPNLRDARMASKYVNTFLKSSDLSASALSVMAYDRGGSVEIEAEGEKMTVNLEKSKESYILFVPGATLTHLKRNKAIWKKVSNVSDSYANSSLDMFSLMLLGVDCKDLIAPE